LLEFRLGTALALPCPEASVDLVFCRFLLEYLPDPLSAVQEMRRVLRPGGLILLQDLDGQLLRNFPPDPVLARAIERTLRSMAAAGFDPHVGRKLFHFAFLAGFSPVSTAVEPYHVIAGRATDAQLREWTTKLDIALPLLRRALGSAESAVRVRDRFLGYLARADTFSYSNVITVVARAPSPPHSP
jgi:SAM-dependent methyltransferase